MEAGSVLRWHAQGMSENIWKGNMWKGNQRNGCEWPVTRIYVVAEKTSSFGQISCRNCRSSSYLYSFRFFYFVLTSLVAYVWSPMADLSLLLLVVPFLFIHCRELSYTCNLLRCPLLASVLLFHIQCHLLVLQDLQPTTNWFLMYLSLASVLLSTSWPHSFY